MLIEAATGILSPKPKETPGHGHLPHRNEICRRAIEAYARRQDDRLARYRELQSRLDAEPGVSGKPLGKESREALYDALFDERSARR